MAISGQIVLVTGANGFVGRHVVARLAAGGADVVAISRRPTADMMPPGVRKIVISLSKPSELARLIECCRPQLVVHAAGRVPSPGRDDEQLLFEDNLGSTLSLLEAIRIAALPLRLVTIGSAAQYGLGMPSHRATREDDPLRPVTPYGVSKAAALLAAMAAGARDGLDVLCAVPFNLTGAGQPAHLVPAAFLRHALDSPGEVLKVGDVASKRDFIDIRDVAVAIEAVALRGKTQSIYNIGSGKALAIADILSIIGDRIGPTFHWEADKHRFGPERVPVSYADIARIEADTGWRPQICIERSISDMIEDMLSKVPQAEDREVLR